MNMFLKTSHLYQFIPHASFHFLPAPLEFLAPIVKFSSFKILPYQQGIVQPFGTEICPKSTVDQLMTKESSLYTCLGYGHF